MSRWTNPLYGNEEIDRAGLIFIDQKSSRRDHETALEIVDNFRASHNYPLNIFQTWLRRNAKAVDDRAIVVQRIKRLFSIRLKLERMKRLRLSEMQDIGGCRAVVNSIESVMRIVKKYNESRLRHKFAYMNDYIRRPKASGYRGVHLIYEYQSDKTSTFNGQRLEIQLRTPLQHAWATAVESVDTYTRQVLKAGKGSKEWKNFFRLMGTVIAIREKQALIPGTPSDKGALKEELLNHQKQIETINNLQTFGRALNNSREDMRDAKYILLMLEPAQNKISLVGFKEGSEKEAMEQYSKVEKDEAVDSVLVSTNDIDNLEKAYPNYFLDIKVFNDELHRALR